MIMEADKLLELYNRPQELAKKREDIQNTLLLDSRTLVVPNFEAITVTDLERLFDLYDQTFFDNFFQHSGVRTKLHFSLSQRMTSAAGKLRVWRDYSQFEIRISTFLLFNSFRQPGEKHSLSGLPAPNRLTALQEVMEHEIIHLIEHLHFRQSSCRKAPFHRLANRIFGHTRFTHSLLTGRHIASRDYQIHVGDTVRFTFEGKKLEGFVQRITKRATVMVKSRQGNYRDKKGNRYEKYYVPIEGLEKKV